MYAKSLAKVLGMVGCQVTPKIIDIGPSEINQKDYKHFQRGHRSRLQIYSSKNKAILCGAAKIHKNSIMETRRVYNWTNMMVYIVLDNIVHHDRDPRYFSIFNTWIEYWESDILRTWGQ